MAYVTPDKYSPYPRVCDICGQLRSVNTMRKLDGQTFVCDKHTGERTKIMLDTLNAHARPPQTWPTEDPKPQNPIYPNLLDASEGVLFNFIDQQITNGVRYENVTAGDGAPVSGLMVQTMAWSARYLYDLIVQNTRPQRYITRARTLLGAAAAALQARQVGYGITPSVTRATTAFYGGVLESGATTYVTNDVAAAGLALLYAYRVVGTATYLNGARAAASYLRNVQAIGSNGAQYTSSNSAGTARLYTGAVCSEVSTAIGVDPADAFYSNHLFYPSGLIVLEFWNALKTTDGDQSVGATAAVQGFDTAPAQLLSDSIDDMRDCWETGITDSTATLINGFSSTTPRELFNAYPETKAQFSAITGTGRWEFVDGNASVGTKVTSQNFAMALGSLYAYEGATTQVTTISDWLRTFVSNEEFETADDTSDSAVARATTGEYDPTSSLSTLLLVRDPDSSYASIKMNGSSLYDWGAFGLLAPLWASRNKTSFMTSRIFPLNINQRFQDGTASDGLYYDHISLRGMSGLDMQTAVGTPIPAEAVVAFPASRLGQGSDLSIAAIISVPTGELTTRGYWAFTSITDPGEWFPYRDTVGELAVGSAIVLSNGTGSSITFTHMSAAIVDYLPFFMATAANVTLANGFAIEFVRTETSWRQACPAFAVSSNPLAMTNDAVRAAQFGRTFRESRS